MEWKIETGEVGDKKQEMCLWPVLMYREHNGATI